MTKQRQWLFAAILAGIVLTVNEPLNGQLIPSYRARPTNASPFNAIRKFDEFRNHLKQKLLPYDDPERVDSRTDQRLRNTNLTNLARQSQTNTNRTTPAPVHQIRASTEGNSGVQQTGYQSSSRTQGGEPATRRPLSRTGSNPLRFNQPGRQFTADEQLVYQDRSFDTTVPPNRNFAKAQGQYDRSNSGPTGSHGHRSSPEPRDGVHAQQSNLSTYEFANQVPASVRAIRLEDELDNAIKSNNSLRQENQRLEQHLQRHRQLLADIKHSMDDSIKQLESAYQANRALKDKVSRLEFEKQVQKDESEKLLDEIRNQLNELLAREISNGG